MRSVFASLVLLVCFLLTLVGGAADSSIPPKPESRTERTLAGWRVRVDDRLLNGAQEPLGTQAIALLTAKLVDIASVVAPGPLEQLRKVPIVLDFTHAELDNLQYHPSAQWLESKGYSRELARCVHIPTAELLVKPRHNHEQPWCVLHELAHAYHDQVLGFDEPRIKQAWENFRASGHGEQVLQISGRRMRHYALTDQKEFFAEMSEAYFGMNDFFPFNNAELKEAEPETFALLQELWGPLAR